MSGCVCCARLGAQRHYDQSPGVGEFSCRFVELCVVVWEPPRASAQRSARMRGNAFGEQQMKSREQALELVETAFLQARHKTGSDVRQMTLAVLNNRLLQLTDRRFRPQHFGAKDLRGFAALLYPRLRLVDEASRPAVEWAPEGEVAEAIATQEPTVQATSSSEGPVQPPASSDALPQGSAGRVRDDLWAAVMDYRSGRPYIWDTHAGRARPAQADEAGAPRMPTLTSVELTEWRLSFVEANKGLQGQALVSAQRWQECCRRSKSASIRR